MNIINNNDQQKKIELSFKLNNVRFFPEDIIEGKISIKANPEKQDNKIFENTNISFSLIQTIFYKIEEFNFAKNQIETKMDNKSYIIDQKTINYEYLKGYSIEIGLQIPFQIQFAPKDDKLKQFYPSFRFICPKINCFVFHELAIEIPGDSNRYAQNIFIKKIPNTNAKDYNNNKDDLDLQIFKEEMIKKLKIFNIGKLSYFVKTKKSVRYNDDLIPIEIHIDENDLTIRLKKINISLVKRLTIKRCMRFYFEKITEKKISLLNNKKNNIIKENIQLNKDEFQDLPIEEIQKNIKDILKEIESIEDDTNLINNKMKFNFTPPLETEFFTFSYLIQLQFDLGNLIEEKKCLIPIDYYDGTFINLNVIYKKNNDNLIGNEINNINNNININNEINKNEINNNEINNNEINNNEIKIPYDIYNGFTIFNKDDFLDTIDGKKKFD